MIRNKRKLDEFYRKLDAEESLSYKEALRIYDALHKEPSRWAQSATRISGMASMLFSGSQGQ